jgi:hypothetical protein
MASNSLVANPAKTTLMLVNGKNEELLEIEVGNAAVKQKKGSKLLGVKIEDSQKWTAQISGK